MSWHAGCTCPFLRGGVGDVGPAESEVLANACAVRSGLRLPTRHPRARSGRWAAAAGVDILQRDRCHKLLRMP